MLWFWWWLMFVIVLFLIPVGYGWGYRGWGPPYPYFYRRGRLRAVRPYETAAPRPSTTDTGRSASGEWGWVADIVWVVLAIAAVWLLVGLFWW